MGRPNRSDERRRTLIRAIAECFAELGYRRTTTATLAARCELAEVALYRLWPDKRAMFVAAIEFVGENTELIWQHQVEKTRGRTTAAERILAHEGEHLGEFGFHRILFAGFSEMDDPVIAAALRTVYRRLLQFIASQVEVHRAARGAGPTPTAGLVAWALVGLGTAANLGRELGILGDRAQKQLFDAIGGHLLG